MPASPLSPAMKITSRQITAVIMAGGKGRRMGGQDKGLAQIGGRHLIEYLLDALQPQVGRILINANRNLDDYRQFGCPVVPDIAGGFLGPLVGIASGLQTSDSEYLLAVPCDSPLVPPCLVDILSRALQASDADISVAHDGQRIQPVFSLLRRKLLPNLLEYLEQGGRKTQAWYAEQSPALADFSAYPDTFLNLNTPADRGLLERKLAEPSQRT